MMVDAPGFLHRARPYERLGSVMKRNLDVAICVIAVCAAAAGYLKWVSPVNAQAPAAQARPLGMENGLTYFQTRCMSCHREIGRASCRERV